LGSGSNFFSGFLNPGRGIFPIKSAILFAIQAIISIAVICDVINYEVRLNKDVSKYHNLGILHTLKWVYDTRLRLLANYILLQYFSSARLTLNARVEMTPDELEQIVCNTHDKNTKGRLTAKIIALQCLSPGCSNPTFRFNRIVSNCK